VQPEEAECYLCGSDLVDDALNYDIADDDENDNAFE